MEGADSQAEMNQHCLHTDLYSSHLKKKKSCVFKCFSEIFSTYTTCGCFITTFLRNCQLQPVRSIHTFHLQRHSIISPLWLTVVGSLYRKRHCQWVSHWTDFKALIKKENICVGRGRWFVIYSPSSDSLSESWLMISFLCSRACSRAAWSFRGNSEASSSIYKQLKTLPSPVINNNVWRVSFKDSDL